VLTQLRRSLTSANVIATVAVFIALGGTSYAVATGSIDSREIKNNTVSSQDIRNNGIRSADVRNRSLLATDFKAGQLPPAPTGATGPTGPRGPAGATNVVVRTVNPCPALPANVHCAMGIMQCQPGERATGGGAGFEALGSNELINVSHPVEADGTIPETGDVPTGWTAAIEYTTGGPRSAFGYVVCASL
jgi:hypothetical protein